MKENEFTKTELAFSPVTADAVANELSRIVHWLYQAGVYSAEIHVKWDAFGLPDIRVTRKSYVYGGDQP